MKLSRKDENLQLIQFGFVLFTGRQEGFWFIIHGSPCESHVAINPSQGLG